MAKLFWIIGALLLVYILYSGVRFYKLVKISGGIVSHTIPYSKGDHGEGVSKSAPVAPSILVLGDSSAVGVGASRPEDSVAGRLSIATHAAYVENHAVSGAEVSDLPGQIVQASQASYSIILIQIGGNDIVRFHNAKKTATLLANELTKLPQADKIILIAAGDVGSAPLFPLPFHPLYHYLNLAYHAEFANALHGVLLGNAHTPITYVNLYTAAGNALFSTDPKTYFAADSFHPSSAGYEIWFNAVRAAL
jgi:lysophospholipase L1-like esterase